ncbi:MAG: glycosyltransferase [Saprospiraceae bacterium]|nr:glycosyltransferase [Saprospiraceae bacterium]
MPSVIILGPAHPLRGGLASFDERLAREWQQQAWNTSIWTFSLQYPGFLFPGTTQYSDEPAPENLNIRVVINSVNPFNWYKVGKDLKRLKPDLIIVRYWLPFMGTCLGTILRIAKSNDHTKIICIADNVIPHEKRPGDRAFTKYFLKSVDAFITMSEKVKMDLRIFEQEKKAVVVDHPLYDNFGEKLDKREARKHLNLQEDHPLVLFFGFIRKYKGLNLLLEAFAKEPLRSSGIRCLVAGEFYEDEKPYLETIKKEGIEKIILMHTQFISDSEVKYYLSAADVVVQPYIHATQSGVTPLAYHFEKPMIVTNVGALPRLVPHGKVGLVCEPNSDSISSAIIDFFADDVDRFTSHLLEEKKKLNWTTLVETIKKLYHDLEKQSTI